MQCVSCTDTQLIINFIISDTLKVYTLLKKTHNKSTHRTSTTIGSACGTVLSVNIVTKAQVGRKRVKCC